MGGNNKMVLKGGHSGGHSLLALHKPGQGRDGGRGGGDAGWEVAAGEKPKATGVCYAFQKGGCSRGLRNLQHTLDFFSTSCHLSCCSCHECVNFALAGAACRFRHAKAEEPSQSSHARAKQERNGVPLGRRSGRAEEDRDRGRDRGRERRKRSRRRKR